MVDMTARSTKSRTVSAAESKPMRDFSRSLPMALLRAREAVMSRFRPMLQDHGLTEQQWRVLRALTASQTPMRFGAIAEATFVRLPSLSRIVKALEARGVLKRVADAGDSRAAQVSLTRGGRALVLRIAPLSETHYDEMAAAIGGADLDRLYRLLERVRVGLEIGDAGADDASD